MKTATFRDDDLPLQFVGDQAVCFAQQRPRHPATWMRSESVDP